MKYYILTFFLLAAAGCNSAAKPVQVTDNTSPARNSNSEKSQTAIAHSLEKQTPPGDAAPSGGKSKWTQGGDAIDTKEFDTAIATAEAAAKSKPNDDAAKKALSNAYFMRAEALKDARQYASALGDYRRALKNDPSNAQAKNWIEQIIMIYDSLGRESPPEGQEPPPLGKKS
jgi:tetratricopeptide (TPR) repeat protein